MFSEAAWILGLVDKYGAECDIEISRVTFNDMKENGMTSDNKQEMLYAGIVQFHSSHRESRQLAIAVPECSPDCPDPIE